MKKSFCLLANLLSLSLLLLCACAGPDVDRENNIADIYDTLDCAGVTNKCSNDLGPIKNCSAYICESRSAEALNCANVAYGYFTQGICKNLNGPIKHCNPENVKCYAYGKRVETGWLDACTGYKTKSKCFELKGCYWDNGCWSTDGEATCDDAVKVTEKTCPSGNSDSGDCYVLESDIQETCENIENRGDCVWDASESRCLERGWWL